MATPLMTVPEDGPRTSEEAQALLEQMAQAGRAGETAPWPGLSAAPAPVPAATGNPPGSSALAMAERRYRALIEQIPVVTFLASLNADAQELYVSPQIERLLGFTQREWLENPFLWFNQLHPDDRQRWSQEFARTCATGTSFRSEYRFIGRDGRVIWVHGECQVIRDENGIPLFLQGIAYDITDSKQAQELMQSASRELEQRVERRTAELRQEMERRQRLAEQLAEEARRKDQFLAVLAHELRNPLAPIPPALALLRSRQVPADQREWAIEMIERQVNQMSRLIDDLLDVSRISRGKIRLQKSVVDLFPIVTRALEVARPLLEQRRHQLVVPPAPARRICVDGDPLRLEQIIVNLLTNAAKYTELQGTIELALATDPADEAEHGTGTAVLRVCDNGIGIPSEMLDDIFEMFTQVDSDVSRPAQRGLGIGLALVRGLVTLHGGTVQARSEGRGRGSEFIVRLPLARTESPAAACHRASPAPPLPRRKILIVEDNAVTARAMNLLLRAWNQESHAVHDSASALEQIKDNPPDLVLADIGLPGMDGYALARNIRRTPAGRDIMLVAISGYGRPEDRRRAIDAGFDFYIVKPLDADKLRSLLALRHQPPPDPSAST